MTPEERQFVARVLGADVARVTLELDARPAPGSWRELLALLHQQHPELIETRQGHRMTAELWKRINYGNEDATERLPVSRDAGRDRLQ